MSSRSHVAATVMPDGNTLTPSERATPAGPSEKQMPSKPRRDIGPIEPTQAKLG